MVFEWKRLILYRCNKFFKVAWSVQGLTENSLLMNDERHFNSFTKNGWTLNFTLTRKLSFIFTWPKQSWLYWNTFSALRWNIINTCILQVTEVGVYSVPSLNHVIIVKVWTLLLVYSLILKIIDFNRIRMLLVFISFVYLRVFER